MPVPETSSEDPGASRFFDQDEPAVGNALIDLLRDQTVPSLSALLSDLFDSAAISLEHVDPRSRVGEMSFPHDQIVRSIEKRRASIEDEFAELLARSFEVVPRESEGIDLDRLIIQPTDDLEERIALADMIEHAERAHQPVLRELSQRTAHMVRNLGIPIARNALSPTIICGAFRDAIAGLDLPLSGRALLFKIFKQHCDRPLAEVYQLALQVLDEHQIVALDIDAPNDDVDLAGGAGDVVVSVPSLDSATRTALQRIVDLSDGTADGEFAAELLDVADAGPDAMEMAAAAQRLSLVGQMCNELLADPHLPESMRPQFEHLRFPLIKIALADGSFFTNAAHPVRRLVNDAAETAASSRISSRAVVRRLEGRLLQIAEQANLSASFIRPQLSKMQGMSVMQITAFLDQQRLDAEQRQESVISKVQRAVAQEIESQTLTRKPPPEAMHFLYYAWGPLLASRLIEGGMNSAQWTHGTGLLSRLVTSLDARKQDQDAVAARPKLLKVLQTQLIDVGMKPERIEDAIEHLRRAYDEVDKQHARLSPDELGSVEDDFELLSPGETLEVMGQSSAAQAPQDTNALEIGDLGQIELSSPGTVQSPAPAEPSPETLLDPVQEDELAFDLNPEPAPLADPAPDEPAAPAPAAETAAVEPQDEPLSPAETKKADAIPDAEEKKAAQSDSDKPAKNVDVSEFRMAASRDPSKAGAPEDLSAASDLDLLGYCLITETWFRVFEPRKQQTLWLRVASYYPQHDSVGFSGFDAKQTLSMRASQLLDDLVQGRSDPVNPTPVQARAIAELRARKNAG